MSWHYSQALVAAYSADTSSAGAPSAPSSGNLMPLLYCALGRMKAFSRLSRFGMTCKPLTEQLGADVLTWCLAVSHAKTLAQPERAQESTESGAECGRTWRVLFARWDRATSSWRTPQCSLLEGLDEFSETWPRWGMMRDGACSAQLMPAHLTGETESGLLGHWPTPDTCAKGTGPSQLKRNQPRLQDAVLFATPCARDHKGHTITKNHPNGFNHSLANQVKLWPTLTASEDAAGTVNGKMQFMLTHAAKMSEPEQTASGGQLNPTWVEWLMGWPLGWTDLKPLETVRCQQWQHSHGGS